MCCYGQVSPTAACASFGRVCPAAACATFGRACPTAAVLPLDVYVPQQPEEADTSGEDLSRDRTQISPL
jgi:hypothetical protein